MAALLSAFVEAGENRKSEKTQAEYRRIVAAEIGVGSLHTGRFPQLAHQGSCVNRPVWEDLQSQSATATGSDAE
ncbi:MAG TPA: hypothetical protein VGQ78_09860 [Vicinamibacteria bacterium]|nr:hypothetical protein [Vicinamibacteria bacterium]